MVSKPVISTQHSRISRLTSDSRSINTERYLGHLNRYHMKTVDHSRLAGAAALLLLCSAGFAQQTRTEHDLLGDKQIPAAAYYGVQTARALENFPISGV